MGTERYRARRLVSLATGAAMVVMITACGGGGGGGGGLSSGGGGSKRPLSFAQRCPGEEETVSPGPCRSEEAPPGTTFVTEEDDGDIWTIDYVEGSQQVKDGPNEANPVTLLVEVTLEISVDGSSTEPVERFAVPVKVDAKLRTDGPFGTVNLGSVPCPGDDPTEVIDLSSPQRLKTCLEASGPPNATRGDLVVELTAEISPPPDQLRSRTSYHARLAVEG